MSTFSACVTYCFEWLNFRKAITINFHNSLNFFFIFLFSFFTADNNLLENVIIFHNHKQQQKFCINMEEILTFIIFSTRKISEEIVKVLRFLV